MTDLRLDDQLCFALYTASRAAVSAYRPVLRELNLTYPQYLVMLVLWEEGDATVARLGARLQLDSGTLSPLLKRLELIGYVRRTRSRLDERSVTISLTDLGSDLRERAECVPSTIVDAVARQAHHDGDDPDGTGPDSAHVDSAHFGGEDIAALRLALHHIASALRGTPEDTDERNDHDRSLHR